MTVQTRARDLVFAIVVLPLFPALICGVAGRATRFSPRSRTTADSWPLALFVFVGVSVGRALRDPRRRVSPLGRPRSGTTGIRTSRTKVGGTCRRGSHRRLRIAPLRLAGSVHILRFLVADAHYAVGVARVVGRARDIVTPLCRTPPLHREVFSYRRSTCVAVSVRQRFSVSRRGRPVLGRHHRRSRTASFCSVSSWIARSRRAPRGNDARVACGSGRLVAGLVPLEGRRAPRAGTWTRSSPTTRRARSKRACRDDAPRLSGTNGCDAFGLHLSTIPRACRTGSTPLQGAVARATPSSSRGSSRTTRTRRRPLARAHRRRDLLLFASAPARSFPRQLLPGALACRRDRWWSSPPGARRARRTLAIIVRGGSAPTRTGVRVVGFDLNSNSVRSRPLDAASHRPVGPCGMTEDVKRRWSDETEQGVSIKVGGSLVTFEQRNPSTHARDAPGSREPPMSSLPQRPHLLRDDGRSSPRSVSSTRRSKTRRHARRARLRRRSSASRSWAHAVSEDVDPRA